MVDSCYFREGMKLGQYPEGKWYCIQYSAIVQDTGRSAGMAIGKGYKGMDADKVFCKRRKKFVKMTVTWPCMTTQRETLKRGTAQRTSLWYLQLPQHHCMRRGKEVATLHGVFNIVVVGTDYLSRINEDLLADSAQPTSSGACLDFDVSFTVCMPKRRSNSLFLAVYVYSAQSASKVTYEMRRLECCPKM